jgi:hypothetical protein
MASDEERGAALIKQWADAGVLKSDMREIVPGTDVIRSYAVQTGKLLRERDEALEAVRLLGGQNAARAKEIDELTRERDEARAEVRVGKEYWDHARSEVRELKALCREAGEWGCGVDGHLRDDDKPEDASPGMREEIENCASCDVVLRLREKGGKK